MPRPQSAAPRRQSAPVRNLRPSTASSRTDRRKVPMDIQEHKSEQGLEEVHYNTDFLNLDPEVARTTENMWESLCHSTFSLEEDLYLIQQSMLPPQKPINAAFAKDFIRFQNQLLNKWKKEKGLIKEEDLKKKKKKKKKKKEKEDADHVDILIPMDMHIGQDTTTENGSRVEKELQGNERLEEEVLLWRRHHEVSPNTLIVHLQNRLWELHQRDKYTTTRMNVLREVSRVLELQAEERRRQKQETEGEEDETETGSGARSRAASPSSPQRRSNEFLSNARREERRTSLDSPMAPNSRPNSTITSPLLRGSHRSTLAHSAIKHYTEEDLEHARDLLYVDVEGVEDSKVIRVAFSKDSARRASSVISKAMEEGQITKIVHPSAFVYTINVTDARYFAKSPLLYGHLDQQTLQCMSLFLSNRSVIEKEQDMVEELQNIETIIEETKSGIVDAMDAFAEETHTRFWEQKQKLIKEVEEKLDRECEEEVRRIREHFEFMKAAKRQEIHKRYEKYGRTVTHFVSDEKKRALSLSRMSVLTQREKVEQELAMIRNSTAEILSEKKLVSTLLLSEDLGVRPLSDTIVKTMSKNLSRFCASGKLLSPILLSSTLQALFQKAPSRQLLWILWAAEDILMNSNLVMVRRCPSIQVVAKQSSLERLGMVDPPADHASAFSSSFRSFRSSCSLSSSSSPMCTCPDESQFEHVFRKSDYLVPDAWYEMWDTEDSLLEEEREAFLSECAKYDWELFDSSNEAHSQSSHIHSAQTTRGTYALRSSGSSKAEYVVGDDTRGVRDNAGDDQSMHPATLVGDDSRSSIRREPQRVVVPYPLPPAEVLAKLCSKLQTVFKWRHHTYRHNHLSERSAMKKLQRLCNVLTMYDLALKNITSRMALFRNKLSEMKDGVFLYVLDNLKSGNTKGIGMDVDKDDMKTEILQLYLNVAKQEKEARKEKRRGIGVIQMGTEEAVSIRYGSNGPDSPLAAASNATDDPAIDNEDSAPESESATETESASASETDTDEDEDHTKQDRVAAMRKSEAHGSHLTLEPPKGGISVHMTEPYRYGTVVGDIDINNQFFGAFYYEAQICNTDYGNATVMVGWDIVPSGGQTYTPGALNMPLTTALPAQYFSMATALSPPLPKPPPYRSVVNDTSIRTGIECDVPLHQILQLRATGALWQNDGILHYNGHTYDGGAAARYKDGDVIGCAMDQEYERIYFLKNNRMIPFGYLVQHGLRPVQELEDVEIDHIRTFPLDNASGSEGETASSVSDSSDKKDRTFRLWLDNAVDKHNGQWMTLPSDCFQRHVKRQRDVYGLPIVPGQSEEWRKEDVKKQREILERGKSQSYSDNAKEVEETCRDTNKGWSKLYEGRGLEWSLRPSVCLFSPVASGHSPSMIHLNHPTTTDAPKAHPLDWDGVDEEDDFVQGMKQSDVIIHSASVFSSISQPHPSSRPFAGHIHMPERAKLMSQLRALQLRAPNANGEISYPKGPHCEVEMNFSGPFPNAPIGFHELLLLQQFPPELLSKPPT